MGTHKHVSFGIICCLLNYLIATSVKKTFDEVTTVAMQMQGYSPDRGDDYVAFSMHAPNGYIVEFEPLSDASRVHHMLLYGCEEPASDAGFWRGHDTCRGSTHILYAWARNAPSLKLPKNVGFPVGEASPSIKYLVLQVHYATPFQGRVKDFSGINLHISSVRPNNFADVLLFSSGEPIPPNQEAYFTNMSCTYNGNVKLHPFAFRTHTHKMGRTVSAYLKHDNKWTEIGKRNPQWPQLFQKIEKPLEINGNDLLAATCRFESTGKNEMTEMGHMGSSEMCNFYMMFYRDADAEDPFPNGAFCSDYASREVAIREYPVEGTQILPKHPEWEEQAKQAEITFGVIEKNSVTKIGKNKLGQISGLSFDKNGNLVVFQRGSRVWNQYSYDYNNILIDKTTIQEPTILIVDTRGNEMKLLQELGQDLFYMPHGIFVDDSNYIYVTDVGSHQVHKLKIVDGKLKVIFSIGEKFVPGNDREHFCKPTAVAVSKADGSIYISDGYCNNRVLKFTKDGRYVTEFGQGSAYQNDLTLGSFNLPHDISIDDANSKIYVADRENGRVQVFNMDGTPIYDIKKSDIFSNVYSAHYCPNHGLFFIPGIAKGKIPDFGYVVPHNRSLFEYAFGPKSVDFKLPHIIRARGNNVFIGEISDGQGLLWKFEIETDNLLKDSSERIANGANFDDKVSSIHLEGTPSSSGNLVLFAMLTFIIVASAYFGYKKFKAKKTIHAPAFFDKSGFQPLSTDDHSDDEMA
uniref:Peptidylglycine monooxygenase n=1 Tax=Rhabditophanes sp. KR3021 TaxID=114890 RepID=A0AC35TIH0_9BILA